MYRSLVTRTGRALLLALLCAVALVVAAPSLANAQESNGKVVRVGWYDSAFHKRTGSEDARATATSTSNALPPIPAGLTNT
ncbi:MAG: hypothetical protein IKF78_08385 [Atopobiaceae bacterium]|nr:hypothetical protein [Atopobiaceae bacterium]